MSVPAGQSMHDNGSAAVSAVPVEPADVSGMTEGCAAASPPAVEAAPGPGRAYGRAPGGRGRASGRGRGRAGRGEAHHAPPAEAANGHGSPGQQRHTAGPAAYVPPDASPATASLYFRPPPAARPAQSSTAAAGAPAAPEGERAAAPAYLPGSASGRGRGGRLGGRSPAAGSLGRAPHFGGRGRGGRGRNEGGHAPAGAGVGEARPALKPAGTTAELTPGTERRSVGAAAPAHGVHVGGRGRGRGSMSGRGRGTGAPSRPPVLVASAGST